MLCERAVAEVPRRQWLLPETLTQRSAVRDPRVTQRDPLGSERNMMSRCFLGTLPQ